MPNIKHKFLCTVVTLKLTPLWVLDNHKSLLELQHQHVCNSQCCARDYTCQIALCCGLEAHIAPRRSNTPGQVVSAQSHIKGGPRAHPRKSIAGSGNGLFRGWCWAKLQ
jgi:hypothetical protein